ncbi:MAG TPA: hypothetical protein VFV41_28655 [Streptosporangiaceae bacterium]|nr:hypothetical protein [Streptosporangiaceae bacterium]
MDASDVYPDLFGDALSYSSQRMAQLASLVTAAATVEARRKAQRNAAKTIRSERALRELQDQERAAYALARAGWAAARDPRFLDQADLLQAARAWSAAAAYAGADPEAADAVRRCEERLRVLHPYAMAWYDRLRREGAAPLDAMREALPFFARAPHARPGHPAAERPGLAAPDSLGTASVDDSGVVRAAVDFSAIRQAEQRGQQIVRELQARALAGRGYALSSDELVTTLGASTTLPGDVIARLARADSQDRVAWEAERTRADDLGSASAAVVPGGTERGEYLTAAAQTRLTADTAAAHAAGDRNATRLAAESFPCTATDAVTAAAAGTIQAAPSAVQANAAVHIRRPGRSA